MVGVKQQLINEYTAQSNLLFSTINFQFVQQFPNPIIISTQIISCQIMAEKAVYQAKTNQRPNLMIVN
jgi:hypothetical protein